MSTTTIPSVPRHDDIVHKAYGRIRDTISLVMHYSTLVIEDIVKPSIKAFLETCDTKPQVAAIVATPALLAILFTLAFLVLSTLVLVIWTATSISLGIVFVVVSELVSLSVKLIVVAMATLPLAGIATGLLIAGNYVSQFITKELLVQGQNVTINRKNWQRFVKGAFDFKHSIRSLSSVSSALSTVGFATFSAVKVAAMILHDASERNAAASLNPRQTAEERDQHRASAQELRSTNPIDETQIRDTASSPSQEDWDSEVVFVKPITVVQPDDKAEQPIQTSR